MNKVIFLMMLLGTVAHAEGIPSLTAQFSGYSKKTNHSYTISQAEKRQWKLEDVAPCPSYPCSPSDFTVESKLTPELISDSRIADGSTEIQLSDEYKITFINNGMVPPKADGTREESYWKLTIGKNGTVQEEVKLSFQPILKSR